MSIETRLSKYVNDNNLEISNKDIGSLVDFVRYEILTDREKYMKDPE